MALPYAGKARRLSPADTLAAAKRLGVPVATVVAVSTVETGGASGFLDDGSGRSRMLFEAKRFGDGTGHQWDVAHPFVSCRVNNWKLYRGGVAEYGRLAEAAHLNETEALQSASWGLFQVMGSNYADLGYASVLEMVQALADSEAAQLEAFVGFCERNHLVAALQARDWSTFARGYNGPAYAVNGYDTKLLTAYMAATGVPMADDMPHLGCTGAAVAKVQDRLNQLGYSVTADGLFGRATDFALRRWQSAQGLTPDGIAGPATLAQLGVG